MTGVPLIYPVVALEGGPIMTPWLHLHLELDPVRLQDADCPPPCYISLQDTKKTFPVQVITCLAQVEEYGTEWWSLWNSDKKLYFHLLHVIIIIGKNNCGKLDMKLLKESTYPWMWISIVIIQSVFNLKSTNKLKLNILEEACHFTKRALLSIASSEKKNLWNSKWGWHV